MLATWFGVGYLPVAPGTWGTLAAMPLAFVTASWPTWIYVVFVAVAVAVAVVAAGVAERSFGAPDPQCIVVDEVVGYLVTVVLVPRDDFAALGLAFLVFRVLDITKPPPIRWLERRLSGGLGVVLDDVAAGLLGAPLVWLARSLL